MRALASGLRSATGGPPIGADAALAEAALPALARAAKGASARRRAGDVIEIRFISGPDVERAGDRPRRRPSPSRARSPRGGPATSCSSRASTSFPIRASTATSTCCAYVAPLDAAGVKVVGDYVHNWKLGLPSELALLTLYDPAPGCRA